MTTLLITLATAIAAFIAGYILHPQATKLLAYLKSQAEAEAKTTKEHLKAQTAEFNQAISKATEQARAFTKSVKTDIDKKL